MGATAQKGAATAAAGLTGLCDSVRSFVQSAEGTVAGGLAARFEQSLPIPLQLVIRVI